MIRSILNKAFSVFKIFEEERVSINNKKTPPHNYSYKKDKARYAFIRKFIAGNRILDMACGEGMGANLLSDGNGRAVYGLDSSERAILSARENFSDRNISFVVGDAYKTGFRDGFFTSIVSIETVEHLEDHDLFLSEIKRILKKDGILVISSPERVVKDRFFDNPHHINLLYKDHAAELLRRYFTVTDIYCQTPMFKGPSFMVSLSFIFSGIFLSSSIVRDRAWLTGTNIILICRNDKVDHD